MRAQALTYWATSQKNQSLKKKPTFTPLTSKMRNIFTSSIIRGPSKMKFTLAYVLADIFGVAHSLSGNKSTQKVKMIKISRYGTEMLYQPQYAVV